MTYINPRLKHVKRIKKICTELEITGAMPGFLWQILHQCNLLLETKKAKKRKCNCETNYKFEPCPVHTSVHQELSDFVNGKVEKPDPKEEMKEIEKIEWNDECEYDNSDIGAKLNELVERVNILSKRK